MEAGKSYTVNFTVVTKRSSARWSRCFFAPYSDINGVKAASANSENVISYVKEDTSEKAYGYRSLYGPGASSQNWLYFDWAYDEAKHSNYTKLPAFSKSGTTFTAKTDYDSYEIANGSAQTFNKVVTIKSDAEMEELGVTVNSNGTYERNGVTYNNFFAIELSGSSAYYTPGENADAMVTANDANGNPYYQLFSDYYITNLEITSDDYVATLDLMNGEEKLTTVILDGGYMKNSDVVIPEAEEGKYFSGWYLDEALTKAAEGTLFMENATYYAKWSMYGDCDENEKVDTTDLAALKLNLAGSGEVSAGADCNDSGLIDTTDLAALKLFLAGSGELGPEKDDWRSHPEDFKLIALTFDDAPAFSTTLNNSTVKIIDTLNRYEGAGTLFVIGTSVEKNGTALLEYALQHGFELGNHSYSHPHLNTLSRDEIKTEIVKVNEMLNQKLGVNIKYLRPGYGSVNDDVYSVTTELNMPIIWSCINGIADYETTTTVEMIERKVIDGAVDGGIVLLHSQVSNTAAAMETICSELYAKGYRFVTVSELFEYKGIDINDIPKDKFINSVNF